MIPDAGREMTRRELSIDAARLLAVASLASIAGPAAVAEAQNVIGRRLAAKQAKAFGALVDALADVNGQRLQGVDRRSGVAALTAAYAAGDPTFQDNIDTILRAVVTGHGGDDFDDAAAGTFDGRSRRQRLDLLRQRLTAPDTQPYTGDPERPVAAFGAAALTELAVTLVASFDADEYGRTDASITLTHIRNGGY